jgi:hypothetical protein
MTGQAINILSAVALSTGQVRGHGKKHYLPVRRPVIIDEEGYF